MTKWFSVLMKILKNLKRTGRLSQLNLPPPPPVECNMRSIQMSFCRFVTGDRWPVTSNLLPVTSDQWPVIYNQWPTTKHASKKWKWEWRNSILNTLHITGSLLVGQTQYLSLSNRKHCFKCFTALGLFLMISPNYFLDDYKSAKVQFFLTHQKVKYNVLVT